MTSLEHADQRELQVEPLPGRPEPLEARLAEQWIWFFLALGAAARLIRYALRFPLWEDEAFLSANFLGRGYADLAGGLDYYQVCPLGFLWVQLTLVRLLGFTEYSLRLFPLLCGLAGLLLFRHLAGRFLKGTALVLAVAIFSVSYPGIRYAAEAKQYGADLLVSLVLLCCAVEWWRRPARTGWLWGLAALAPVAVGLSYPAVFVGGGISLFAACVLWREKGRRGWMPWLAFNASLVGSFVALYALSSHLQSNSALELMQRAWQGGFPPLTQPLALLKWLVVTHTGDLLAYPVGGRNGASTLTFLCCAAGMVFLARRRQWAVLAIWLLPLVPTLIAAALKRYPYGQMVKFQFYLAPVFCMLAGLGAAWLVLWRRGGQPARPPALRTVLVVLAAIGLGSIARDVCFPAKSASVMRIRDFARWFWFTAQYDGEVACLKTDLGEVFSPDTYQWGLSALYLCNQRIYSPRHARGETIRWDRISADHPLRCVEYHSTFYPFDAAAQARWLESMQAQYELVAREQYRFTHGGGKGRPPDELDYLQVYKFVPREPASPLPKVGER